MAPNRWGDTCPLLNIARHFGVDYADVLVWADWLIHMRTCPDWDELCVRITGDVEWRPIRHEIVLVADRFYELRGM